MARKSRKRKRPPALPQAEQVLPDASVRELTDAEREKLKPALEALARLAEEKTNRT